VSEFFTIRVNNHVTIVRHLLLLSKRRVKEMNGRKGGQRKKKVMDSERVAEPKLLSISTFSVAIERGK